MKIKTDTDKEKKFYKLWWEYLKRSQGYKDWLKSDARKEWDRYLKQCKKWNSSQGPLRVPTPHDTRYAWSHIYGHWGDVHKQKDFEAVWKRRAKYDAVRDYTTLAPFDLAQVFANVKVDPLQKEIYQAAYKNFFVKWITMSNVLILAIDLNCDDLKGIKDKVGHHVIDARKKRRARLMEYRRFDQLSVLYNGKGSERLMPQIENYLTVYDLKRNNASMDELRESIFQEDDDQYSATAKDVNDAVREYSKFAERIIKNVEHGIFPGEYRNKTRRIKKILHK